MSGEGGVIVVFKDSNRGKRMIFRGLRCFL